LSRSKSRREEIQAEAEEMADAFSRGEAHYATAMPNDPTPDKSPEDQYFAVLAEAVHRLAPELAAIAFQGKGALYGRDRAFFLVNLWKEFHKVLYALPEQTQTVNLVPLPSAKETSQQWRDRISQERKSLPSPSPSPDPKAS
jgi:hypothetical protein